MKEGEFLNLDIKKLKSNILDHCKQKYILILTIYWLNLEILLNQIENFFTRLMIYLIM